jgi:L-cysteine S-thiosulfotransferase
MGQATRLLVGLIRVGFTAAFCLTASSAFSQTANPTDPRRSGFAFMGESTQAMQKDDSLNPGMLWVGDGEALWKRPAGASGKACISCHAAAASSMRGVAARYPAFDDALKRPITLSQRVNQCRQKHQQAEPLRAESQELLSLESYVAHQSRGLPVAPPDDARLEPYRQRGQQRFVQRLGQLGLSCAQCHDDNAGKRLGGSTIPQAHPIGYPVYRLEWQTMGSLQRRLRNCMSGVRAEPFAFEAQELVELELYLNVRAKGMAGETPGVRP